MADANGQAAGDAGGAAEAQGETVVIKKYANRRLYNTAASSYVTLDHLSEMVREGIDFCALQRGCNRCSAELMRGHCSKSAIERTHRRAGG